MMINSPALYGGAIYVGKGWLTQAGAIQSGKPYSGLLWECLKPSFNLVAFFYSPSIVMLASLPPLFLFLVDFIVLFSYFKLRVNCSVWQHLLTFKSMQIDVPYGHL